jgi:hypothetical protein
MEEARHSFTRLPHTCGRAHMEAAQQTTATPQAHPQEPQWDTGYGGGYSGHHESGSYYPSHGYPERSFQAKTFAFARYPDWYALWSDTSVLRLTRLSTWWKGSDDSSDVWMNLHTCKQRCKPPSTHRPA